MKIDGHEAAFVLDTASSGTMISPQLARSLALGPDGGQESAVGMTGAKDVPVYRATSVDFGERRLAGMRLHAIEPPPFDDVDVVGLAGVDLFEGARATFDFQNMIVAVEAAGRAKRNTGSWQSIASHWLQPWKIMLPVTINGVRGTALLDTGAQHSVLNPAFARRAGLRIERAQDGIAGLSGEEAPLARSAVSAASIGSWRWRSQPVLVGALPLFERLGSPDQPMMVLGMDWLRCRAFTVDYRRRSVAIRVAASKSTLPRGCKSAVPSLDAQRQ